MSVAPCTGAWIETARNEDRHAACILWRYIDEQLALGISQPAKSAASRYTFLLVPVTTRICRARCGAGRSPRRPRQIRECFWYDTVTCASRILGTDVTSAAPCPNLTGFYGERASFDRLLHLYATRTSRSAANQYAGC